MSHQSGSWVRKSKVRSASAFSASPSVFCLGSSWFTSRAEFDLQTPPENVGKKTTGADRSTKNAPLATLLFEISEFLLIRLRLLWYLNWYSLIQYYSNYSNNDHILWNFCYSIPYITVSSKILPNLPSHSKPSSWVAWGLGCPVGVAPSWSETPNHCKPKKGQRWAESEFEWITVQYWQDLTRLR